MKSTDDATAVTSTLLDVREVPLAELPTLGKASLDSALQRILPESSATAVPVAAFSSAI
jgi:FXSXX-COOH protein